MEVVALCRCGARSTGVLQLPEEVLDSSLRVLSLPFLPEVGHFASAFAGRESGGRYIDLLRE